MLVVARAGKRELVLLVHPAEAVGAGSGGDPLHRHRAAIRADLHRLHLIPGRAELRTAHGAVEDELPLDAGALGNGHRQRIDGLGRALRVFRKHKADFRPFDAGCGNHTNRMPGTFGIAGGDAVIEAAEHRFDRILAGPVGDGKVAFPRLALAGAQDERGLVGDLARQGG